MIGDVSTSVLRLKFKGRIVELKLYIEDDELVFLDINAPVNPAELKSFKKITAKIVSLVRAGVKERNVVAGNLNKLVDVDPNVLSFMTKVVKTHLPMK